MLVQLINIMNKLPSKIFYVTIIWLCFGSICFAQDRTIVHFVFDASGSMAEEVNGETKIALAKQYVERFLGSGFPAEFGLTVFGSEESGGSEAYYTPVPPSANTSQAILDEMTRLDPAGMSPIAAALIDGSQTLDANNNNYVILITDGVENAGGGPVRITSTLRNRGIVNRLYVAGFLDRPEDNPLISQLIRAGNGSYHSVFDPEPLVNELQDLAFSPMEIKTTGIIGYRSFITQANGFPAYGTSVELRNESGRLIESRQFWRGIVEDLEPGSYTLTAKNKEYVRESILEVSAGNMTEHNFVFNISTGGFSFNHYIKGTNDARAYGTVTSVIHENGEIVYTGTSWSGVVNNLPEGIYTIEGSAEGLDTQTNQIMVKPDSMISLDFYYSMQKGRISFMCYLDSLESKVANGTIIKIFHLPYRELALERSQWRGTSPFLPLGRYEVEGYYKGYIRQNIIDVRPDSTAELKFVFNISQVRFSYRCFRNQSKAPATGVNVQIYNNRGQLIEENSRWRGSFVLPEGVYTLTAQFQGKTIRRTLNLFQGNTVMNEEDIYFDGSSIPR